MTVAELINALTEDNLPLNFEEWKVFVYAGGELHDFDTVMLILE